MHVPRTDERVARHTYPSDLTDEEWAILEPLVCRPSRRGSPSFWPTRRVLDAVFYVLRSGCAWRLLPHDFPPWQTVVYHFRRWRLASVWHRIHEALRSSVRKGSGRDCDPSAGVVDSQSVKTAEGGPRGYDAAKRICGRKRHLLVDSSGLLLAAHVTPADTQDRDGARRLLAGLKPLVPRLERIWADRAYRGKGLADWCERQGGWRLEIVKRGGSGGFEVVPRRWVVERTFSWLGRHRRLSKDYERNVQTSETLSRLP